MGEVNSEAVQVCMAPQPVLGVDPNAGWVRLRVDKGSIRGWKKRNKFVEPNVHSKFATAEKGDVVGMDVEPGMATDLNKDTVDLTMEAVFRCSAKHFGGTGLSLFRPTAVTATGYTVAANGNIPANVLFYARGSGVVANDGLKKSVVGSTNVEIKTGGLTIQAATPANMTIDLVGIEASVAADLQIDANGDLTSATVDFRTLGVQVGMWLILPTAAQAATMGSANYALALYNGRARIKAIDQVNGRKLTLERRTWVQAGADLAAGKTLRVFFASRFYRNYALDDADYKKAVLYGEKEDPNAGADNTTRFTYVKGCAVGTAVIDAPLESKITLTLSFVGMDATNPLPVANRLPDGAGRGTGPGTALAPLAYSLIDTQNDLREIRLSDANGQLLAEITAWNVTINNNVKARKAQGDPAAKGHSFGQHDRMAHVTGYFQNSDLLNAASDNRDLTWYAYMQNHQYAALYDMPYCGFRNDEQTYAANEPVMVEGDVIAFRNEADNIELSLSVFGYVP